MLDHDAAAAVPIVGIAFDLDDTLHSRQRAFAAYIASEVQRAPRNCLDPFELAALDRGGYGDKRPLLAYLARCFDWPEVDHESRHERLRSGIVAAVEADAALESLMGRLRARYRLALISNGRSATQRGKLDRLGVTRYFDPIVVSEEVGAKKPAPEVYERVTQAWRCSPEQVLVVGDHPELDVIGARALGMQTVWISAGRGWSRTAPRPLEAHAVHELEPLLARYFVPARVGARSRG